MVVRRKHDATIDSTLQLAREMDGMNFGEIMSEEQVRIAERNAGDRGAGGGSGGAPDGSGYGYPDAAGDGVAGGSAGGTETGGGSGSSGGAATGILPAPSRATAGSSSEVVTSSSIRGGSSG